MHAYHFTTWDTYQIIKETGLRLAPIAPRHFPGLKPVTSYIQEGAVWLYHNRFHSHKLFGMLIHVAVNHHSDRIVRLRVEYVNEQTTTWRALQDFQDCGVITTALRHSLDAGPYGHFDEPIELLLTPVEPHRIHLDGDWNLLRCLI